MDFLKGLYALLNVMFFSSQTIINTSPVNIDSEPTALKLPKPVTAINHNASIKINVSHIIGEYESVIETLNKITEKFPKGCLEAILHTHNGATFTLDKTGADSNGNIIFHTFNEIPIDIEIEMVEVTSCYPIKDATLIWINGSL